LEADRAKGGYRLVRYVAKVSGWECTVELDRSGGVTICDTSHSVDLESIDGRAGSGNALFCLFVDGEPHEIFAECHGNRYYITVDGTRYDVQVEEEQLHWLREGQGKGLHPGRKAGEATVVSPMPGIVLEVLVEEGQAVRAGDRLAILEAMKMENEIQAPCSGVVESVHVVSGQTVNLRDVIVRIVAPPDAARSPKGA
jgi:biotin carboxyl carrier protein